MPMASSLAITAGRVLRLSAPMVGSRLISQISPLRMEIIPTQSLESRQFQIRLVIYQQGLGSSSHIVKAAASRTLLAWLYSVVAMSGCRSA
jgi:hypothetical protein